MLKRGQFPLPRPNAGVWALPFSLARHEATGEPFLVAAGADVPSVSNDGTLVHVSGVATRATRMAWVDREGKMLHPIGPPQEQWPFPELSPDGRYLLFADFGVDTFWDISYLDLQSGGAAVPLVQGKPNEIAPRISPDARYFAYVSDESGPDEVFLKRFPAGEGHWQVSTGGGAWPRFSRRGDRLYYVAGDSIMEVDIALGSEPKLGAPRELFVRQALGWSLFFGWAPGYDVSADGNRFVVVEPQGELKGSGGIVVEENWSRELAN